MMMEQKDFSGRAGRAAQRHGGGSGFAETIYQLSLALARLGDEAGARQNVQMYQAKLRAIEDRVKALRAGGAMTPVRVRPPGVPR